MILSTPILPCHIIVRSGSNCCSVSVSQLSPSPLLAPCTVWSSQSLCVDQHVLAHFSRRFPTSLHVHPIWTFSSTPSPKSSSTAHPFSEGVGRGPRSTGFLDWEEVVRADVNKDTMQIGHSGRSTDGVTWAGVCEESRNKLAVTGRRGEAWSTAHRRPNKCTCYDRGSAGPTKEMVTRATECQV